MKHHDDVNRREFLQRVGAGALLGAAGANSQAQASSGSGWTPPPVLKNPNILVILVDQMRLPVWMTNSQFNSLSQTVLPNIMGRLQNNSYHFAEYFTAATVCTASRATLLTGLYAPQTATYCDVAQTAGPPALNPAFPTWGQALPALNPAYAGNLWWFGKWHLSNALSASPLLPYGFNTRTYPGGPAPYNPDPSGMTNEGTDGGLFNQRVYASDAMIAGDFIGWLQGQAPSSGPPGSPWCATISLINPHDIISAPAWLQSSPFPPTGVTPQPVYFPPPAGTPPAFYGSLPSPWNYEDLSDIPNKPALQLLYFDYLNTNDGSVSDWVLFLNQYYWLQNFVDQQVGLVLNALESSPFANNTIVVFLSDHGEYAGSHGLHGKGSAVYDESIRVPFYVQFPGQSGAIAMNQMCSEVDVFGLICDLATGGSGQWRLAYPDLANRQSMWSFLYNNSSETRVSLGLGLPYILHTFDEWTTSTSTTLLHILCLRTKLNVNAGQLGAKLAFYYEWAPCTTYPDSTTPNAEFYDYDPNTTNNTSEMGNDYYSTSRAVQKKIANYIQAMGTLGPVSTGLIAGEMGAPLVGTGMDGNPLTQALASAQQAYFTFASGAGVCPTP